MNGINDSEVRFQKYSYLKEEKYLERKKVLELKNITNVIIDLSKNTISCNICNCVESLIGKDDFYGNKDLIENFKLNHKKCFNKKMKK